MVVKNHKPKGVFRKTQTFCPKVFPGAVVAICCAAYAYGTMTNGHALGLPTLKIDGRLGSRQ